MNASKLFAAIASFAIAGSAFALDLAGANAAATVTAAAQASYAAQRLNVPVLQTNEVASPTRAQVHAEAVEAVKNSRPTFATQYEF